MGPEVHAPDRPPDADTSRSPLPRATPRLPRDSGRRDARLLHSRHDDWRDQEFGHHAENPEKRFKVIAADNPNAELIGYVRAKHQLEVALYEELDADRAANGWFKSSSNVTKTVNLVMSNFGRS